MEANAHAGTDAIPAGQPVTQELNGNEGQSASETQVDEQPNTDAQESLTNQDTSDSPKNYEEMYKTLQTDYGKRNESFKELEGKLSSLDSYGGLEQMQQWASYLNNNESFAEWVKQEQTKERDNHLGLDNEDLDDDTRRALDLVRKEAEYIADQRIKEAMQNQVDPLVAENKERSLQMNMDKMDETYDDWREVQDEMSELAAKLPPELQDNPTFETLDDLYWKAMRTSGKMETFAAKQYEKRLESRKATSTEKPSSVGKGSSKKAMTMAEAFAMAKEAQT